MTFVLFGATGDLAQRKIMPALCSLFLRKGIGDGVHIVAWSRRPWSDDEYRAFIRPSLAAFAPGEVALFLERVSYSEGTFDDASAFLAFKEKVASEDVVYHLAVRPEFYPIIVDRLREADLKGKLLIEKPFGHDYASAQALERTLEKCFAPEQIYRVDHYLGKEGLDAVLSARRQNADFEKSLTKEQVAQITCRIEESLDIHGRGEFYDSIGAFRDVGQSHLLLMLATVLMDLPTGDADVSGRRAAALALLSPDTSGLLVRGQYEGYTSEEGVLADSQTETYFKISARSSTPRWQDVTLVLEAGKALKQKKTEIEVHYQDGTHKLFNIEVPRTRDAYEVLIEAALAGDRSRFVGTDEMVGSWRFADAATLLLRETPLRTYQKGSDGPTL